MAFIGRLLLRLIVVSLGAALAIGAGTVVSFVANWNRFVALVGAPPDSHFIAELVLAAAMAFVVSQATFIMLMPASIGILIAEAFAIRSWIFHVLNGALSIWVGWATIGGARERTEFYDDPFGILASGLAAGLVYWAVAGWNAGVMRPAAPVAPPSPGAAAPR